MINVTKAASQDEAIRATPGRSLVLRNEAINLNDEKNTNGIAAPCTDPTTKPHT